MESVGPGWVLRQCSLTNTPEDSYPWASLKNMGEYRYPVRTQAPDCFAAIPWLIWVTALLWPQSSHR